MEPGDIEIETRQFFNGPFTSDSIDCIQEVLAAIELRVTPAITVTTIGRRFPRLFAERSDLVAVGRCFLQSDLK